MKKLLSIVIVVLLISFLGIVNIDNKKVSKSINYNGTNLMVTVDDKSIDSLPTSGNYYLVSYECDNINALVSWDRKNYKLSVSNGKDGGGVSCSLNFKSNPLLNEMKVGSYVEYVGTGGKVGNTDVVCKNGGEASSSVAEDATESSNSCRGENAREDLDSSNYTYGYCYSTNSKYYTTGFRIAYVKDDKVKLISAGAPECINRTTSIANEKYIKMSNASAVKYCNKDLVDGECVCDSSVPGECDSASSDVWAVNDSDFYYMTSSISDKGKRLTLESSMLGVDGGSVGTDMYCYRNYSYLECGYNNDLIDNGGYYWFASKYSSVSGDGVYWNANSRGIDSTNSNFAYGLRPVVNLSSTVYVVDGDGTMSSPYKIANKK